MSNLEKKYPALAADAETNSDSAILLALIDKTEKMINEAHLLTGESSQERAAPGSGQQTR